MDFPGSRKELPLPQPTAVLTFRKKSWRHTTKRQLPPFVSRARHARWPQPARCPYRVSASSAFPSVSLWCPGISPAVQLSHHPIPTSRASLPANEGTIARIGQLFTSEPNGSETPRVWFWWCWWTPRINRSTLKAQCVAFEGICWHHMEK